MTRRRGTGLIFALCVSALVLGVGSRASAQMGPGMMGGMMGQGPTSVMPMQQMSEVIKQMADRLAAKERPDAGKAERLRGLADQLIAATGQMTQGMGGGMMPGGVMGPGMMGQGPQLMGEISRILEQMKDLLRGQ